MCFTKRIKDFFSSYLFLTDILVSFSIFIIYLGSGKLHVRSDMKFDARKGDARKGDARKGDARKGDARKGDARSQFKSKT